MEEILIIDDNQRASNLENFLKTKDYSPIIVDTVEEGLDNINTSANLKVVLLNVASSGKNGLDALQQIKNKHPDVIVIIIGAGVNTARKAMRLGALDVLSKPIDMKHIDDMEHINTALGRAFSRLSIRSRTSPMPNEEKLKEQYPLVGESPTMFELNKKIGLVANDKVSVLLEGETGTGKELVARLIHDESERAKAPFITIDCGAVPSELRESEMLGYEEGAFTGARSEGKPGQFELADGGTLFLDEVANMTPALQETLLNVLQTREVLRVGGTYTRRVDMRVISATNQKLEQMVMQGEFRKDLFYRLCGYQIDLPPLRERKEDIALLTAYFLQNIEAENGKLMHGISGEVMNLFHVYNWPGNVRELEHCLKSATVTSQGEVILMDDLPENIRLWTFDEKAEKDSPGRQTLKTQAVPAYKNLLDLPLVVFCQFIVDGKSVVTNDELNEWWVEFSNDGRRRANKAKRKIDNWLVEWNTSWLTLRDLSQRIKDVIDEAVMQLSQRHKTDSEWITEAEPVSIKGRTLRGSLTAVLHEVVKAHGGDREKAAKELDIPVQHLEKRLSYIVNEYGGDREKAAKALDIDRGQLETWLSYWTKDDKNLKKNALQTDIEPSRELKQLPNKEEIRNLLTKSVISFVLDTFSGIQWRDKSCGGQKRSVHLALKVLSQRLAKNYDYIYFGGMTLTQIEKNIYRQVPYLYRKPAEAAAALNVVLRTFRQHWPEDKVFPSHPTLFTLGLKQ